MQNEGKKCLVEGYGFMGEIHARLLREMGCEVACVSRRRDVPFPVFQSTEQAVRDFRPDIYIIASPTAAHIPCLQRLEQLGYANPVLVEKPLASHPGECNIQPSFPVFVAYNMRFAPVIVRLQEVLDGEAVVSARLSVGGYLPGWRPGRDYRGIYSTRRDMGGGVLRDLSHELDLARLLLGDVCRLTALVGKLGDLEMDCEDTVDMLMTTKKCRSVTIHLDCLDRNVHRFIALQTATRTIHVNLLRGTLTVNGATEECTGKIHASYQCQLKKLLTGDHDGLCAWHDALAVMEMIALAEASSLRSTWVSPSETML